jgi:pimeloyl-ACP methyl ester carboxylesterase
MHVEAHGAEGAPVLALLHGGGLAGWMWDAQVAAFRDTRHVLVFDLPGHGASAGETFTTIADASRAVARELRARDRSRGVSVVGFSLGAQIALQLVSTEPGLADTAVIVSALALPLRGARFARPLARLTVPLARWRSFARLQARATGVPDAQFEDYFRSSRSLGAGTLGNLLAANMRFGVPEGWADAPGRIDLVVGGRERAVMLRSAELLRAARPATGLTVVPDAGHGFPLQQPARVTELLQAHLAA